MQNPPLHCGQNVSQVTPFGMQDLGYAATPDVVAALNENVALAASSANPPVITASTAKLAAPHNPRNGS
jgi:hypothetical protein